jgi:hypothetical protein
MLAGAPKEVKSHEYRVCLVAGSVRELIHHGHQIVVQQGSLLEWLWPVRREQRHGHGLQQSPAGTARTISRTLVCS